MKLPFGGFFDILLLKNLKLPVEVKKGLAKAHNKRRLKNEIIPCIERCEIFTLF